MLKYSLDISTEGRIAGAGIYLRFSRRIWNADSQFDLGFSGNIEGPLLRELREGKVPQIVRMIAAIRGITDVQLSGNLLHAEVSSRLFDVKDIALRVLQAALANFARTGEETLEVSRLQSTLPDALRLLIVHGRDAKGQTLEQIAVYANEPICVRGNYSRNAKRIVINSMAEDRSEVVPLVISDIFRRRGISMVSGNAYSLHVWVDGTVAQESTVNSIVRIMSKRFARGRQTKPIYKEYKDLPTNCGDWLVR